MILRTALAALLLATACAAEPALKPGDHVAIIGDSITEQRQYSRNIEVYLLSCSGIADLEVAQFGWGGERAEGFANHCAKSVSWFKPTVATTCYGMNDGGYTAYTDAIGKYYKDNLGKCADLLKRAGVRSLVLSSPGAVDTTTFKRPTPAAVYNESLGRLGDLAKALAAEKGAIFADTHGAMIDAMAKAKAAYGEKYHVCGGDGVHPDANGHLLMAGSILAALGCDGGIARITLGADGKAEASAGHTVLKAEIGAVELESRRWPFLLGGDGTSPNSTRSIAPFTDFVERLDRFVLVMPDCAWAKAKITWGDKDAVVEGDKLKQGVNLIALFKATPFDQVSVELIKAVQAKQDMETALVKGLLNYPRRAALDADPEGKALFEKLIDRELALRGEMLATIHAALKPVKHRIAVSKAD